MVVRVKPCLVEVEVSSDDRGCFIPFSHAIARDLSAHTPAPKRAYVVYNYGRGVVRGFHFHAREWKYFFVAGGAAKFVAVDPEDPRDRHVFVASIRKPALVVIPPGYANGWVSLEDRTTVVCLSSATFEESLADDTRYDPLTWGDVWSVRAR